MSDGKGDIVVKFGSPVYLGIGVLYHLITSDIPFAWSDPWLYITMALWPFMLLGWIFVAFVVISAIWLICTVYSDVAKKRQYSKKQAKIRMERHRKNR